MTLFLIQFDRQTHQLVGPPEAFAEHLRKEAGQRLLQVQGQAIREKLDRDIVLLAADSEADLHRTHSSFFRTAEDLLTELKSAS